MFKLYDIKNLNRSMLDEIDQRQTEQDQAVNNKTN